MLLSSWFDGFDGLRALISIIVPAYNMEMWLGRCVGSLERWMTADSGVEIIVVNDGSTDRTSAIAHELAAQHPESVRVIDKPNGHYGSAVNAGVAAATGLYVKTLDADDSFDPDGFAALLSEIAADASAGRRIDLYLSAFDAVDAESRTIWKKAYPLPTDRVFGLDEILAKTEEVSMHACAWRLDLLREIEYRQSEGVPYSDVDWILYPMLQAKSIRYLTSRLYLYQLGREGQSVSFTERRRNADAWIVILNRILSFTREKGNELAPLARDYLRRITLDMARMHLEAVFVLKPMRFARTLLPRLVRDLEAVETGLSARLEDEAQIMKSSFHIHYFRIWRRLPVGKLPWMILVRTYLAFTRWKK